MMEKSRSPRKKIASVPGASLKEAPHTPVKNREDRALWTSMVSSPPSPTSPTFRKTDIERFKPLIKSGRTKSLEFACALARSSDLKSACNVLGSVGVKRKRLEDFLLEPKGRKVKKIRRTFSSGVRESHKGARGLRKVASAAVIPLSQAETKTKEQEIGRPVCSTKMLESSVPFSGSSLISNVTTMTTLDNKTRSPTLIASPESSVETKVTDRGANAKDKENKEPVLTVKDLEKNAVEVLASLMGTRV